jgi:hypothetical protein
MTTEPTEATAADVAPDLSSSADQLVSAARSQGVELTGPAGLLTGLTKQVLETALDVELTEHLGHDRHERSAGGNVRNGRTRKTVRTDVGDVRITVPQDRAGTFAPAVVPKHTRRLAGFDDAVLSLYAKGMTTGDIANRRSVHAPTATGAQQWCLVSTPGRLPDWSQYLREQPVTGSAGVASRFA